MKDTTPTKRLGTAYAPWIPELWALGGSGLAFAGMVALLRVFDDRPIFDWYGVTLNTLVSILSAAMKAALIYAISECISQWKWILFSREERLLIDFERMDSASRGPLGGINVLWKTRRSIFVRLGAFLTLLAIALDPFSQQLVQLRQGTEFIDSLGDAYAKSAKTQEYTKGDVVYVNSTNSTINPSGPKAIVAKTMIDLSMQGSILNGFSRSLAEIRQQANVTCPTGQCTWPPFKTLGVCHTCHNLTSDLKRVDNFGDVAGPLLLASDTMPANDSSAFVLPNGHFMAGINGQFASIIGITAGSYQNSANSWMVDSPTMTAFGSGNPQKTNRMQDVDTLIWSTSMIYVDTVQLGLNSRMWPDVPVRASECALYYCVQNINATVEGNTIYENTTEDTDAKRDPNSWQPKYSPLDDEYAPENIPPNDQMSSLEWNERYSAISRDDLTLYYPQNSSGPIYTLSETGVKPISAYFPTLLTANMTGSTNVTRAIVERLGDHAVGYNGAWIGYKAYPEALRHIFETSEDVDLPARFAALGASMTNDMRRNGDGISRFDPLNGHIDLSSDNKPEYGLVGVATTYYSIEWGWIVLHAMMLAGGLVFWLLTARNSSRPEAVQIWKSSSLAVLRQGRTTGRVLEGSKTMKEMRIKARKQKVLVTLDQCPEDLIALPTRQRDDADAAPDAAPDDRHDD
ncbi:hypothetical protein NYO67_8369 [Aspergillus flavus]|nr:hypothetical protein NYO67_8369 [Aspergillus flavus]